MDRDELCSCLITWIGTFESNSVQFHLADLSDGLHIASSLNKISSSHFDDNWLKTLKADTTSNWRLKASNLKKVLKKVLDFYAEVVKQTVYEKQKPDVNAIAERCDSTEMSRLLQLILGCAVNCADKQQYIEAIMGMKEREQHIVMQAIQELMMADSADGGVTSYDAGNEELSQLKEELNRVSEEKEELAQRCHQLDSQIGILFEEKSSLELENEKLNERLHASSLDDISTPAGRRIQQLQTLLDQQQNDIFRFESEKEDLRIQLELKEKELYDFQEKNNELTSLAEEAQNLKDENDVLRHTADKVVKFEATIETLKKKLESKSDLDGQLKILEEKNTSLIQANMEQEEEVRKLQLFRSQCDVFKRQLQELQVKAADETKRADKAAFEAQRNSDKLAALQREKETLREENTQLLENIDNLRGTKSVEEVESSHLLVPKRETLPDALHGEGDGGDFEDAGLFNIPPKIKEKLIRLELENKRLRSSSEQSEGAQLLQSMLDDVNARNNELQTEVRLGNQRIMELEATVEDLREAQTSTASDASGGSSARLLNTLNEQVRRSQKLASDLDEKRNRVDELEPELAAQQKVVTSLEKQLADKQRDMAAMEDKYKGYLEKAKMVIHTLKPSKKSSTGPEILTLRNQLAEKERFIEHLQQEYERKKAVRDDEEKLIVTAWYNMCMKQHRSASDERIRKSFLDRQRNAQTLRPTPAQQAITPTHLNSR